MVFAELGLIAFSSTSIAGEFSEFAYRFYKHLLGFGGADVGLHTLVQKGVHFVLFFALGTTLFHSLSVISPWKVCLVIGICFLAGIGSEGIQLLFATRHASIADVLLNWSSGTFAALLGLGWSP